MDPKTLEALREKYAETEGGDIFDPVFRKAASAQFSEAGKRALPYANVSTFLALPHLPAAIADPSFCGLEAAIVGVPMDLGVTNRSGARFGPKAVRSIERIGPFDHVLQMAPSTEIKVADIGDVPLNSRFDLARSHADIEAFYTAIVDAGIYPLSVGGDHSISGSILRAIGREKPVGMIHIDAHCDTSGPYEGCKFHHGGPFRQAVLDGVLDPQRTIQIGIRGGAEYLWEFSSDSGMTVLHVEDVISLGIDRVIEIAHEVVGKGPVYLSFDIDSLDPGFAPGTGTPEVGGLQPREAMQIMRGLNGLNFIGSDVVEVAPQYDPTTNTAQAAAQILFIQLCLAATAIRQRKLG
ncbi:agmatinase [Brucella anthropi]|uniref:agmatinase n=1 Tax=Brucella TaxID=234 RepID=UPI00124E77CD|nr:agmatinase [Brucella anthropi]KAB2756856.1 agmatinase [Brucella anthropi]MBM6397273.1 agmatinase [Brucella anthropi]QFP64442.1 agmatinase [Brucella anthropi]QPA26149.1 agmatinase [Brucella anthropi]